MCHDEAVTDRLAPIDTAFLYTEDASAPLHVGGVIVVQPRGEFDFRRVAQVVEEHLAELPRFRQVVRRVPGNVARPVWIDATDFDVTYHVRRSSLPTPGTDAQLSELVGRLISRPLDRTRPLWELYIIEGLAGGRVAIVNKTHEALVADVGAVDLATALLDDAAPRPGRRPGAGRANSDGSEPRPTPWVPAPEPSDTDLLLDAISELIATPATVIDVARLWRADLRQAVGGAIDIGRGVADTVARSLSRLPRSLLHASVPGPRIFATVDLDLAMIKAIRHRHGTSVNDVILAVVSGALRSWLISHGDPVSGDSRFLALAPMSVRAEDPATDGRPADVVSFMINLPVAEPNAVMRLHQVAFHTRTHAESGRQVGATALLSLGRFAPAALHLMGARLGGQLSRRSYDLLVTNVPGPQRRLYAAGDPVVAMYPVVPLVKGHGVAVGCTSYRGRVYFGLTADRDVMPDVAAFARLLADAAAELARTAPLRRHRADGDRDAGDRAGSDGMDGGSEDGSEGA